MDLLCGYGSGSDSDGDGDVGVCPPVAAALPSLSGQQQQKSAATAQHSGGLFSSLPRPKNAAPVAEGSIGHSKGLPAGFFDAGDAAAPAPSAAAAAGLPAGFFDAASDAPQQQQQTNGSAQTEVGEAAAGAQLFSKLPAASKRRVLLRPQMDLRLLAQQSDSDDEEPVAKKIKAAAPAAGKPSILSFLPAPKNAAGGKRMDVGSSGEGAAGGSSSGGGFAEAARQRKQQQQQEEEQAAAAAAASAAGPAAAASNEAYRLRPAAGAAGVGAAYAHHHQQQHQHHQQQHYGQQDYSAAATGGYYEAYAGSSGTAQQHHGQQHYQRQQQQQLPPEEAFLQEALQAEASKAARRAAGAGSSQLLLPDIQFKEIKADEVKYVDPAQREAAQGTRSALGTDYAQQLRAQAAPHMGSKLARSKHQIGTLFANAKLRELEVMENRASGMKSKAETAGKYGWS